MVGARPRPGRGRLPALLALTLLACDSGPAPTLLPATVTHPPATVSAPRRTPAPATAAGAGVTPSPLSLAALPTLDPHPRRRLAAEPHDLKSPAWAPDGRQVVYVRWGEQPSDLYVADMADAAPPRRLVTGKINVGPAWGPAGIAFASDRGGNFDLYLVDPAGGTPRQLTHSPNYKISPTWGPGGQVLAYLAEEAGRIWIFTLALTPGATPQRVPTAAEPFGNGNLAWSPDGRRFAFMTLTDQVTNIETVAADGSDPQRVTAYTEPGATAAWPAWSAAGLLVYVLQEAGGAQHLVARRPDGREVVPLLPDSGLDSEHFPAWAPAGTGLAFISDQPGAAGLYTVDVGARLGP